MYVQGQHMLKIKTPRTRRVQPRLGRIESRLVFFPCLVEEPDLELELPPATHHLSAPAIIDKRRSRATEFHSSGIVGGRARSRTDRDGPRKGCRGQKFAPKHPASCHYPGFLQPPQNV